MGNGLLRCARNDRKGRLDIIQSFISEGVRGGVFLAGDTGNRKAFQRADELHHFLIEGAEGGVFYLVKPVDLFHHQLGVRL